MRCGDDKPPPLSFLGFSPPSLYRRMACMPIQAIHKHRNGLPAAFKIHLVIHLVIRLH